MKHIIEKHVTTSTAGIGYGKEVVLYTRIESDHFPALISDLEAEMCKIIGWALNNAIASSSRKNVYHLEPDFMETQPLTTAELLKIYQNKEK